MWDTDKRRDREEETVWINKPKDENTMTEFYLSRENILIENEIERRNFILYCEFMMFDNDINNQPPDMLKYENIKDYFRSLFKHIWSLYEEDFQEGRLNA